MAALLSESGTGDSSVDSAYVVAVDSTAGVKTGVALFNPGSTASALTFTLFDVNGATGAGKAPRPVYYCHQPSSSRPRFRPASPSLAEPGNSTGAAAH